MGREVIIYITTLLLLVGCYNSSDKPSIIPTIEEANLSISNLRSDVVGNRAVTINDDIVLRGRVTSSDREDNFYRTIFVEDATGAVEVMVGLSPLYSLYPEGVEVALHLRGCRADYWRGVLQIGVEALGSTVNSVDYITLREGVDRIVRRGADVSPLRPEVVNISDLRREMCGRLVCVEDITAVASTSIDTLAGQSLRDAYWRGSAMFKDSRGDSIAVEVSDYARFANAALPLSPVTVTGILEWGSYAGGAKECYHLTMRYEEDCSAY